MRLADEYGVPVLSELDVVVETRRVAEKNLRAEAKARRSFDRHAGWKVTREHHTRTTERWRPCDSTQMMTINKYRLRAPKRGWTTADPCADLIPEFT